VQGFGHCFCNTTIKIDAVLTVPMCSGSHTVFIPTMFNENQLMINNGWGVFTLAPGGSHTGYTSSRGNADAAVAIDMNGEGLFRDLMVLGFPAEESGMLQNNGGWGYKSYATTSILEQHQERSVDVVIGSTIASHEYLQMKCNTVTRI